MESVSASEVRHAHSSVLVVRGQEHAQRRGRPKRIRFNWRQSTAQGLRAIVRAAPRRGLLPTTSASAAVLGSSESLPQQGANDVRYGRGGAASEQRLQARAQR